MDDKDVKISIIVPSYNRSKMLRQCIDSFLGQTINNWELIVVDDGSEEDLSFVTSIDKKIRYFKQERNGYGAPRARNLGKRMATGKYLLTFDNDDIALPGLLEKTSGFLDDNPDYDVVYTDNIIRQRRGDDKIQTHRDCNGTSEDYQEMLRCQFISHSGTLWRRVLMPYYDEDVVAGGAEDWDIFLTAMEQGLTFFHLPETLWMYRVGHEKMTKTDAVKNGCIKILAKRGYGFNPKTRTGFKL